MNNIIKRVVVIIETTGVFVLGFIVEIKFGSRLSLAMASGFLDAANNPPLPVVINAKSAASSSIMNPPLPTIIPAPLERGVSVCAN